MSHQPFETWLLSNEPLDSEQKHTLDTHLGECEQCNALSGVLIQLNETFSNTPSPAPSPGFTQRWHTRLSRHRQQRQQRNMWFLTLGLFGIAGLILVTMMLCNLNSINWAFEFGQFIASFSIFAARINRFWNFIHSLTHAFPILIPIMTLFGLGMFSAISALVITWFSFTIKLFRPAQEGGSVR